jgi:hypothetical protein
MPDTYSEAFKQLLATPEPAELGPGPRAGVCTESELNRELSGLFARTDLPEQKQELIHALVLLWHDHLDAAHTIAQDIEDADGAYVHGIMHRREPDYGNAGYWFRRVGKHPVFGELARRVTALLNGKEQRALLEELAPAGEWDAFAFIDHCERAAREPATRALLQDVQLVEFETLMDWFCK